MHPIIHPAAGTAAAPNVSSFSPLQSRAAALMGAYPDIHAMAWQAARSIVAKHTGKKLDPNTVYWHRFAQADNSSLSFTGWEHIGPPQESVSLTELVMQRFSASDNVSADQLNTYSGFYQAGPDEAFYSERNEVPMLPSDVLKDFWTLDFAADCQRKADAFWQAHGEDFCTFSKMKLLSAAGQASSRKQLRADDFDTVLTAVTGGSNPSITWEMLQTDNAFTAGAAVQVLELAGHVSRDMLQITDAGGRQILYMPGAQQAFQCFDDEPALYQWLHAQVAEPASKARLMSHFARGQRQAALNASLSALGTQWTAEQARVGHSGAGHSRPISSKPVFELMRDMAREEMNQDIRDQLTRSASLRKQMVMGYLGAFIRVGGGIAPLAWPLALTLVGAGIAEVGLSIDQAVSGRTAQLRKAGVYGAIINSVYLFLNLPLLADIGRASDAFVPQVPAPEQEVASLAGLEGNEVLDDAPPAAASGQARGVQVLENGETWITLGELPYRVRYLEDLNTWAVVDPNNPFAFNGAHPVRLNEFNQWELSQKPGLQGGKPPIEGASGSSGAQPYATTSSPFWDTYMKFNLAEEERLSDLGNHRQESIVSVYELDSDEEVVSDSEGEDVVYDAWNEKHRVFKTTDNGYFGGAISRYSDDDDAYNLFLRTGERRHGDQIEAIERLIEDVSEVQPNNDVALFRGGCGDRGTSGKVFREGRLKVGDVLVNTDFTSFSENPYLARVFASSQAGAASSLYKGDIVFDETSVVFELPAKEYLTATPVSPFSHSPEEVESLFQPGNYFQIRRIEEVAGSHYRFMNVQLRQVPVEQVSGPAYDLRTGVLFSRQQYAEKLGEDAQLLVDTFFPPHS